jgi:hypothetical protein
MDSIAIHHGHILVEMFFLQEKALHVPQFANINSLICNKCYAGLPCLSQVIPEISSLEKTYLQEDDIQVTHVTSIKQYKEQRKSAAEELIYSCTH